MDPSQDRQYFERSDLQRVISGLQRNGFRVVGPVLREGAIVYDEISSMKQLPSGWMDIQENGKYHLEQRSDGLLFNYNAGPQSWKHYLHPPNLLMFRSERRDGRCEIQEAPAATKQKLAFLGVRACELHAIEIQDRIFCEGPYRDADYEEERKSLFIVAVNCTRAGGTCFCTSMKTGPRVSGSFDLALTELPDGFVVEVGSPNGASLMEQVPHRAASASECEKSDALVQEAAGRMGRHLNTDGLREALYKSYESRVWDHAAQRCLSCTNCTMVCPTCFCTTIEDVTDLTGATAERRRRWDSCFTLDFSYIHGGTVRSTVKSRYRQWLTHKLATWIDQFGSAGCVGCGRCITWCPVGIDITEEAEALRGSANNSSRRTARSEL